MNRRFWQSMKFGLKTLLVGMGLVAVALFLLFAAPPIVATVSLIAVWVTLSAVLTAGVVYGHGGTRAFCVGALFPPGATVFALTWILFAWLAGGFDIRQDFQRLFEYLDKAAFSFRVWSAGGWVLLLVCGAACAIGRRALTPPSEAGTPTDRV